MARITYSPPFHYSTFLKYVPYRKAVYNYIMQRLRELKRGQALLAEGNLRQIEVQFFRLDIFGDPDGMFSVGDYYWQFDVNGDVLIERTTDQALSMDPGTRHSLTGEGTRQLSVSNSQIITLSGWVNDRDGGLNFGLDDFCGEFWINVPVSRIPNNGSWLTLQRKFQGVDDSEQTIHVRLREL